MCQQAVQGARLGGLKPIEGWPEAYSSTCLPWLQLQAVRCVVMCRYRSHGRASLACRVGLQLSALLNYPHCKGGMHSLRVQLKWLTHGRTHQRIDCEVLGALSVQYLKQRDAPPPSPNADFKG